MNSTTVNSFSELALAAPVLKAITAIGYEQPSPIQAESIPLLLEGRDILGIAQTGTGKTAAFALPLLSKLDLKLLQPQVLVLAPTRELAIQVSEAFQRYANELKGFHVLPIYGGQDMRGQLRQLKRGVHVVVGTPGRIIDHLRRASLTLDKLQAVVLDEADEMLRMGFIDDVTWILEHTPEQKQVALFSATMPTPIRRVADRYLNQPQEVSIKSQTQTVERIEQHYWTVSGVNKLDALTRILEVEPFDGIIIFVRTKTATVELAEKLEARGYASAALNGDMSQALRERTVEHLKNGKIDIVVATDVAARGIDVSRISLVVNYDIPYDTEAYVHRIGRTGRAGRSGKAILFVAPREKRLLKSIEKATRQTISSMQLPSREQVNEHRIGQFIEEIDNIVESENLTFFNSLVEDYLQERSVSAQQLAAALAHMAQRGKPLFLPAEKPSQDKPSQEKQRRKTKQAHSEHHNSADPGHHESKQRDGKRPKKRNDTSSDVEMETFRLAVGKKHKATPADIVGAIANEAGIESGYIGRICLFDDYSTVELPAGMPKAIFNHLQSVYIKQQPLRIGRLKEAGGRQQAESGKPDTKFKHSHKKNSGKNRKTKSKQ